MKLSPVWIAVSMALSLSVQANADYSLNRSSEADTSRWRCDECSSDGVWHGDIYFGLGYLDNDGSAHFNNWNPPVYGTHSSDKRISPSFNADIEQYQDDGYYNRFTAVDLGLQRFLVQWEVGQYDGLQFLGSYSESPYYRNYNGLSAYQNSSGSLLSEELSSFTTKVTRETFNLALKYTPYSPWKPYATMKHEQKQGTGTLYSTSIPGYGNVPGYLPKPIEHETLNTHAGVSYVEENWMADVAYRGSFFRNDRPALYYGTESSPYANHIAYEPDNDFHQLALSGNYRIDRQTLNGRLLWSRSTSEGGMAPFPQSPVTSDTFHGEINTFQLSADYHNRFTRQTAFKLSADYRDRDDDSDKSVVIGTDREEYDRDRTKLEAALDHRLNRSLRLKAGYDYQRDRRSYADREETEDQTLFLGARYRPDANWSLGGKIAYHFRDGSNWKNDDPDDAHLRNYYLADRDRIELRGDGTYELTSNMQLVVEAWYADDEYPTPDIGISEGKDYGYDVSINFYLDNGVSGHAFVNQQTIRSTQQQANTDVIGWGRYSSESKDNITTLGFGLSKDDLLEDTLLVSFDYSYHRGEGSTATTSSYQYPDNESTSHRFEFTGDYQLSDNQNILINIRYENYDEDDYLFTQEAANMGDVLQSYEGLFGSVYWRYRF
ncbi:MtrB/PioB family decaheme-associated outer membrane protein [Vibrio sp. CAU 1672]|uniref:MtrB/PioB family decaheme-associated outer membrane protein n=1 Tax=Vibrio sp. CAU 1672 TaxID=3032594 RepID=UPI0023DA987E|nr:MtrB/PioB family decaheme-associated outer membrane protein [Vibrio sp. CAU 1672]